MVGRLAAKGLEGSGSLYQDCSLSQGKMPTGAGDGGGEQRAERTGRDVCVSFTGRRGCTWGPIGYATQVALDYFWAPFLALKARLNSALAELAPEFQSCVLPHLFLADCPQCPGSHPANWAPAEGIDDRQISQHPRKSHQQDHRAQGVVGVVWNINRGEGDPGSSLSPDCLWRDREIRASHDLITSK